MSSEKCKPGKFCFVDIDRVREATSAFLYQEYEKHETLLVEIDSVEEKVVYVRDIQERGLINHVYYHHLIFLCDEGHEPMYSDREEEWFCPFCQ